MSSTTETHYCASRFRTLRRKTREVRVGSVAIGDKNPIRLQSMTTSDTLNVDATVRQCINLAEVGCEIIRITAPSVAAAAALRDISQKFRAAGFTQPLVADIHFIPAAAMEAVEHVEKVRINPGNYADKKRANARDYTDAEYAAELQHLHATATPLILRAKTLGRALRIGTNHGSLSDRIVNRYGDSPLGMVESALEFIRVCESHGFRDIVLSMKSSNPKVMIAAYRLAAVKMAQEGMDYPLHLGVTEAGEGQDGRIKSAIGIGALLQDGLGDTLRVSLTEDPWYEVPVAADLARRAEKLWAEAAETAAAPVVPDQSLNRLMKLKSLETLGTLESAPADTTAAPAAASTADSEHDSLDPLRYERRETATVSLGEGCPVNAGNPPRVIVSATKPLSDVAGIVRELREAHASQKEIRAEGLLVRLETLEDIPALAVLANALREDIRALFIEFSLKIPQDPFEQFETLSGKFPPALRLVFVRHFHSIDLALPFSFLRHSTNGPFDANSFLNSYFKRTYRRFTVWLDFAKKHNALLAINADASSISDFAPLLADADPAQLIYTNAHAATLGAVDTDSDPPRLFPNRHALGGYRTLAETLKQHGLTSPIWIRNTEANAIDPGAPDDFPSRLLEASMLSGALFCDGLGDLISIETAPTVAKSLTLAYDILQGARMRVSKTEYVACPSCGRTLFDIQSTTQKIKIRTGHLKGVTIAVMGCIVNGPGEMADADFGYVGGAPGKINLYVRRECVKFGIPQEDAVERLVDLIKEHGKWVDPDAGK